VHAPNPADVIYVGRETSLRRFRELYPGGTGRSEQLGNQYVIGPGGTRGEVVAKFREFLHGRPDLLALRPGL
jgi:hypothetical protein